MGRHATLFCVWLSALALSSGCRKDAPTPSPSTPPAIHNPSATSGADAAAAPAAEGPSMVELCVRAQDNTLAVLKASNAPLQTLNRMASGREAFLERCESEPRAVIACLADAPDRAALAKCSWQHPDAVAPNSELELLCNQAYDNALRIAEQEGAPVSALQQMRAQRENGVVECTREPEALVKCLVAAQSTRDLAGCKAGVQAGAGPVDPAHEAACRQAFANTVRVIRPGKDMPAEAVAQMASQEEAFVMGCLGQARVIADCMGRAKDFEGLQGCAP